jgi:hypothetical protein
MWRLGSLERIVSQLNTIQGAQEGLRKTSSVAREGEGVQFEFFIAGDFCGLRVSSGANFGTRLLFKGRLGLCIRKTAHLISSWPESIVPQE